MVAFPQDGQLAAQAETAFKDMTTMVTSVLNKWPLNGDPDRQAFDHVFSQYFPQEFEYDIMEILDNMALSATGAAGAEYGSEELGSIMLTNDDFDNGDSSTAGYLFPKGAPGVQDSWMHIGPKGYNYPSLADVKCEDLGSDVSSKMLTFGGYLLVHELS